MGERNPTRVGVLQEIRVVKRHADRLTDRVGPVGPCRIRAGEQALAATLAHKQHAAMLEQAATQVLLHLAHHEPRQPAFLLRLLPAARNLRAGEIAL